MSKAIFKNRSNCLSEKNFNIRLAINSSQYECSYCGNETHELWQPNTNSFENVEVYVFSVHYPTTSNKPSLFGLAYDWLVQDRQKILVEMGAYSFEDAQKCAHWVAAHISEIEPWFRSVLLCIAVRGKAPYWGTASKEKGLVSLYADSATDLLSRTALPFTLIHELSHIYFDGRHNLSNSAAWAAAQKCDKAHVTEYAMKNNLEDVAETFTLYYFWARNKGCMSPENEALFTEGVPSRIGVFEKICPPLGVAPS